jgi:hypothetical protein
MESEAKYVQKIRDFKDLNALNGFWNKIKAGEPLRGWPAGFAFEYMILRAFEIDGAAVTYPYPVELFGKKNVEQIDGLVSIENKNLHVLVESKEWDRSIPFGPIAKIRSQLMRRPSALVGSIFTASKFSIETSILAHFLAPQTIMLWTVEDIEYCFENEYFVGSLEAKYHYALREGKPHLDLKGNDPKSKKIR